MTLSSECDVEGGNKQVQVCVTVERNDCWEVFLHAQHWLINKTGLPLQMKVHFIFQDLSVHYRSNYFRVQILSIGVIIGTECD